MKQFLTLKNVLKLGAALLAIIATILMFGSQLSFTYVGDTTRHYIAYEDALFGKYGSVLSFVGYLLMLIGGLVGILVAFTKTSDQIKKYITIGVAVIVLTGAIFVFVEAAVYNNNVGKTYLTNPAQLAACPIIAGILGILASLALAASEFVPDMQLVK